MSQAVGAPVRVQLMRWDEIGWDRTAPASLMDVRAGIDGKGNLVAFDFTHFYPQYVNDGVADDRSSWRARRCRPPATAGQLLAGIDVQHPQQPLPGEVAPAHRQLDQGALDACR